VLALCLSAWLALNGEMTPGVLVTEQMLLLMLSNALIFVVEYLPSLRGGRNGMDSIRHALSDEQPVREAADAKTLPPLENEIIFDHIRFAYAEGVRPRWTTSP